MATCSLHDRLLDELYVLQLRWRKEDFRSVAIVEINRSFPGAERIRNDIVGLGRPWADGDRFGPETPGARVDRHQLLCYVDRLNAGPPDRRMI